MTKEKNRLQEEFDAFTVFEPVKGEPQQYEQYFNCDSNPEELWDWIQKEFIERKRIETFTDFMYDNTIPSGDDMYDKGVSETLEKLDELICK